MRKVYGQSGGAFCPFCRMMATTKNAQGVPVCRAHIAAQMPDLKCMCGKWLDQKESKFGVFYTCMDCGTVSFSRMMEINGEKILQSAHQPKGNFSSSPPKYSSSFSATSSAPSSTGKLSLRDQIREKLQRGEALTPEEVDML